ncbi:three-Cys-motif partner protein TcmP [Phyllobacterium brassicacearum]|uniref:three-Cys-motif partner protein TcmP n=1 Tax=Phyllobacterium brassicacearum TaxID=314235 RepID=UPI001414EF6F|nr:three-Cys-motif partner protein TcmP [Phyllobacterium brassicacearum]
MGPSSIQYIGGEAAIAKFAWKPGNKLPTLKPHSGAKLRLIEHYLEAYFDTVVRSPRMDRLRITLVDGFCGGGAFDDKGLRVQGTPFLLLNAIRNAQAKLNASRAKPIDIDAQFHFVDLSKHHIEFLREELIREGYLSRIGHDIHLHRKKFEEAAVEIEASIRKRTVRGKGRSLFLLDQTGYGEAPFETIRSLFANFEKAECILTFAVDFLIDYLSTRAENLKGFAKVELDQSQIIEMIGLRDGSGGRYAIQRLLLQHIQASTGASFLSPFFIRSRDSNKNLWLVHLSQHATARNVMVDSHWAVKNHSLHQGRGGLEMLGFDPNFDPSVTSDFMFGDHEVSIMKDQLAEDLLRRIRDTTKGNPVRYGQLLNSIANETPARLEDLDSVIGHLAAKRELSILNQDGTARRTFSPDKQDFIEMNRQSRLL